MKTIAAELFVLVGGAATAAAVVLTNFRLPFNSRKQIITWPSFPHETCCAVTVVLMS
jgi:hypothetical protein